MWSPWGDVQWVRNLRGGGAARTISMRRRQEGGVATRPLNRRQRINYQIGAAGLGFSVLLDPLADKLLIVAALVSLVALDRLEAWIAMVIIARELAVTGLRAVAVEQGVVISASWLGKVKTALQIAAVIALIAVDPATTAVDLLVYAAVAVTVISGADYFFGVRRRIEKQRRKDERAGAEGDATPTGAGPG